MTLPRTDRSILRHLDSAIASIIGFVVIYLYTRHSGIGTSPDSIMYASTARNLYEGNGFLAIGNAPLVIFPLFYPLFLSFVMFVTRLDVFASATILNGLLFAAVLFLSGIFMENFRNRSRIYKWCILSLFVLSPFLGEIYTMLWSETLFILLSLLFVLSARSYFSGNHSRLSLYSMSIFAALAFDTRFAGVSLVVTGFSLILFDRDLKNKIKTNHLIQFSLISCAPVVFNLIRNILLSEYVTGHRQKGRTLLSDNISYTGNVLSDWLHITFRNHLFEIYLVVIVIAYFIIRFIINTKKKKDYSSFENILSAFFVVYTTIILITSTLSRYEQINNRLLSPAYIPFFIGISYQLPSIIRLLQKQWLRLSTAFAGLLLCLYIIRNYYEIQQENYGYMKDTGIPGYTEDTWRNSQTMRFLVTHPSFFERNKVYYSNQNQAVYLYTNRSVKNIPERLYIDDVTGFTHDNPIILIWFNFDTDPEILTISDIEKKKSIQLLYTFSDGYIMELHNKY